jgi:hypothetical protein
VAAVIATVELGVLGELVITALGALVALGIRDLTWARRRP